MSDGDALLATILTQPAEDTPRLVYADWLEENGQPERAEFIRLQVNLASCGLTAGHSEPLHPRIRELLTRDNMASWFKRFVVADESMVTMYAGHFAIGSVRRGFFDFVACQAGYWFEHAAESVASHPITRVRFTTDPRDNDEWDIFRHVIRFEDGKGIWKCDKFRGIVFEMPPDVVPTR